MSSFEEGYVDPRTKGFNYGVGWGSGPKPSIYAEAMALAERMRAASAKASQVSWEVDMACRDVRLAEGEEEKRLAIERLEAVVEKYRKRTKQHDNEKTRR